MENRPQFDIINPSTPAEKEAEKPNNKQEEFNDLKQYLEDRGDSVVFLGIEIAKGKGGDLVPDKSAFENYFLAKEDYVLRREIATAIVLNKPLLLEGGTGIGKTSAVAHMCSLLNRNYCKVSFGRNTTVEDVIGNKDIDIVDGKEVFKWHDGKLLKAIREGGIAFLDEYNFQGSKIAGHVNPIIDAILNGYKTISVPENNHEQVQVHPDFRLVAAQNPPGTEEGEEFPGREALGSETFGRWTFHKMPLSMSQEMRLNRRKGMAGKKIEVNINSQEFRYLGEGILESEMIDVPGHEYWIEKSDEIIEMLRQKSTGAGRQMAKDQRQKISFNPRLALAIDKYIAHFYRGDINEVWANALEYFIVNMYKLEEDKEKVREAIKQSYYIPPIQDSNRKGLDQDLEQEKQDLIDQIRKVKSGIPDEFITTKESKLEGTQNEQILKAREIMGKEEVMGPDEIKKAFGIEVSEENIPHIPFSEQELKRAKELNQFLVLRVNKTVEGKPLTMKEISQLLQKDFKDKVRGKVLCSVDWYADEPFYKKESPRFSWALTSKELIEDSTNKNYLQQTETIANYLINEVYKDLEMPTQYQEAIEEFEAKKEKLTKLINTGDKNIYEPEISKLKLNKLTRQSPVEVLYDILIYFQNNNKRLLENKWTWTHATDSDGKRVFVGPFDSDGARVSRDSDDLSISYLGVAFSRNF